MNIRNAINIVRSAFMLGAISVGIASCNHKDLCYCTPQGSRLRVAYDWRNAPEATAGGMCVFFYSLDHDNLYYRFDFANTEGGEIELPAGDYRIITYNNDTEAVRFSATNSYTQHEAYTRNGDLLEPLYGNGVTSNATTDNGERVVITPDGLWGCHAIDISVSEHSMIYTSCRSDGSDGMISTDSIGNQVITLFPHDMLCHYSYEVRHVENADRISRVSASLSGMSPTLYLTDESLDEEPTTLPVPGQADGTNMTITGQFLTFGHNPANGVSHKMTFYVVMDDGSKYVVKDASNLDVTSQVDTAANRRRVHIIIDGLRLPRNTETEEGFSPSVDDWGVKEEDLKI